MAFSSALGGIWVRYCQQYECKSVKGAARRSTGAEFGPSTGMFKS